MPLVTFRRLLRGTALAAAALLGACGGDSNPTGPAPAPGPGPGPAPAPVPGPTLQGRAIFGLTCANQLVLFGSGNPGTLVRQVPIGGMPAGHAMLGIDFRSTGGLYGVGSDSRVYTIDTLSGAASPVGGAFTPAVSGDHFGLAFSGSDDRLWLHSVESEQNQSFDPGTGATATVGGQLAYAAGDAHAGENPGLAASGYLESAGASTLYGIETNANTLVTMSPASGELTTVAAFGFNLYLCSGLDIDSDGTAYAALSTDSGNELYTINLASGAATLLGDIAGSPVHSIALRP